MTSINATITDSRPTHENLGNLKADKRGKMLEQITQFLVSKQ